MELNRASTCIPAGFREVDVRLRWPRLAIRAFLTAFLPVREPYALRYLPSPKTMPLLASSASLSTGIAIAVAAIVSTPSPSRRSSRRCRRCFLTIRCQLRQGDGQNLTAQPTEAGGRRKRPHPNLQRYRHPRNTLSGPRQSAPPLSSRSCGRLSAAEQRRQPSSALCLQRRSSSNFLPEDAQFDSKSIAFNVG